MPGKHGGVRAWLRPALLLLALHASAFAAEHHGRVLFNGAPVPGAVVTATHGTQQLQTVTDGQGIFQFLSLADGEWTIRIAMRGFAMQEQTIKLDKSAPASSFELKMLSAADVLALATMLMPPPIPPPLVARPKEKKAEVVDAPAPAAAGSDVDKSADGLLINGSENNAATSKYSISQAFGSRRPGAKGLYTGSIGAQVSASPFDARPYSVTGLEVPKASYNTINGVVTLGGPLKIPHLLRDGPTFFVGYQWMRTTTAGTQSGLVPTEAQRSGDLSNTLTAQGTPVSVVDPTTGCQYHRTGAASAQAQALLELYPLPNLAGNTRYNYQTQVLTNMHADALQSRMDKSLGRRDQVCMAGLPFAASRARATRTSFTLSIWHRTRWVSTAMCIGRITSRISFCWIRDIALRGCGRKCTVLCQSRRISQAMPASRAMSRVRKIGRARSLILKRYCRAVRGEERVQS